MEEEKIDYWSYEIKCRRCGLITEIYHSPIDRIPKADFLTWVLESKDFGKTHQCPCHNGKMMIHDIVSIAPILCL